MLMLSDFMRLKDYDENWNVRRVVFTTNDDILLYEYKKSLRGEMAVIELPVSTLLVVKEQPCPR